MLRVLAVGPGGTARGTWFATDRQEYLAQIRVNGPKVTIFTVPGSIADLTRQGSDQLVGTFRGYPVALTKVRDATEPALLNLARMLVGKWEGEFQSRFGRALERRTLYIDSVIQKNGQWGARGRYGVAGWDLGTVDVDVDDSGKLPGIRFTGSDSIVRLSLVGDNALVGTITFLGGNTAVFNEPSMNLRRVEEP